VNKKHVVTVKRDFGFCILHSIVMNTLMRPPFYLTILLMASLTFTSCKGEHVCAGLNRETGKANSSKSARRAYRGGYRSPKELAARDRQKKHAKRARRQRGHGSMG
jgi:hypothetical protein